MGCNCEFYTQPGMLENKGTKAPLVKLQPNAATEHIEKWRVISNVKLPPGRKTADRYTDKSH